MLKIMICTFIFISMSCFGQEICDNGIDDDGDGLIDINDSDCLCNPEPVPSMIANSSFEEMSQCPWSFSQLHYSVGWIQASVPTTDYQNICGLVFQSVLEAGLVPFPDGNGIVGGTIKNGYREYLGSCLTSPMLAGTTYRLTFNIASVSSTNEGSTCDGGTIFYEPIPITLYGNSNCSQLPIDNAWQNPNATDPTWFVIGSAYYEPASSWQELTITFTPLQDINTIILGAPEYVPESYDNSYCNPYFLYDNLTLNESASFGVTVTQSGSYCSQDIILEAVVSTPELENVSYQWYKDGIAMPNQFNSELILPSISENVAAYSVMVTHDTGCSISNLHTIYTSLEPAQFTFTLPTCITLTGSISITSAAPYYSIDNGNTWVTSPVFSGLQPGQYHVRTKFSDDCISGDALVNLFMPVVNIYPQFTTGEITCTYGGDITIISPADQYSFDGGITWQQSNVLQNPDIQEQYELMIKTDDGCTSQTTYTYAGIHWTVPYPPEVTVTQPSCESATATVVINSPQASFSYDDGNTWTTASSMLLEPGVYSIRVKNSDGCISPSITIAINPPVNTPLPPQITISQPNCYVGTGTITITTPASEYSYDNGDTWFESNTMLNLAPGTYSIRIRNSEGCTSEPVLAVISSETGVPPTPTATISQPNCFSATGIISITSPSIEYSFDNGITWSTSNTSPQLPVGSYFIKTKNAAGCESPTLSVIITPDVVPPPLANTVIYCKDSSSIPLIASGVNLMWYTSATDNAGSVMAPIPATGLLGITSYYVTQTINGCESERTQIDVHIIDRIAPPLVSNVTYCQNDTAGPLMAMGQNLLWYLVPTGGNGSPTSPISPTGQAGNFIFYVSQSAYGCESDRSALTVTVIPTPPAPETQQNIIYFHYQVASALFAVGNELKWYDEDMNVLQAAPVPPTAILKKHIYYVSQTINGCESQLVKIIVNIVSNNVIPNYPKFFSPNGDGLHDTWNIRPIPNSIMSTILIFDRYGKVLAKVYSPGAGWDGTYHGKALPATDYWFKVIYTEYGTEQESCGHFSLLR